MVNKPTADQVATRLEVLPRQLRSVAFSIDTSKLCKEVARAHDLIDEDASFLSQVIGWVLMGFVHPGDAAEAIEDHVDVDEETAKAVADDLNEKLFKKYTTELEKIYAPMRIVDNPKVMDIAAPVPLGAIPRPASMPTPTPLPTQNIPAPMSVGTPPKPMTAQGSVAPHAPQSGWQPTRLAVPSYSPAGAPPVPVATPFPASITSPAQPKPATPAPFILQAESAAAPLAAGADFKLNVPTDTFKSAPRVKTADIPRPPKAAELEIGKAPVPKPATSTSFRGAAAGPSRVIHYTDLKSVVGPAFGAATPQPRPLGAGAPGAQLPVTPSFKPLIPPTPPTPASLPTNAPATIKPAPTTSWPTTPKPPTPPASPKPPKVVNFGPEEVK